MIQIGKWLAIILRVLALPVYIPLIFVKWRIYRAKLIEGMCSQGLDAESARLLADELSPKKILGLVSAGKVIGKN